MEQSADSQASTRLGGRPSNKLVVAEEGRKPLFSTSNTSKSGTVAKPNQKKITQSQNRGVSSTGTPPSSRRTNSESHASLFNQSNSSLGSPGGTRIPRPSNAVFSHRRPMSLSEAYKLAEAEEQEEQEEDGMRAVPVDGSPSPAPRPWRTGRDSDQNKLRKLLSQDHLDTKGVNRQRKDQATTTKDAGAPESSTSQDQTEAPKKVTQSTALGAVASAPAQDTKDESRREQSAWKDNEGHSPNMRKTSGPVNEADTGSMRSLRSLNLPELVPGIDDILPSVETAEVPRSPGQTDGVAQNPTPEKSFRWQVDEDFTAGDLQVSDSPRLKTGRRPFENRLPFDENSEVDINSRTRVNNPGSRNTRLDEIRSREVKTGNHLPMGPRTTRQPNTKLDEIVARENEVESQIPIPERRLPSTAQNTKLDEIRQREVEGLSRRRLATARLEEIKERNFLSGARSPEAVKKQATRRGGFQIGSRPSGASAEPESEPEPASRSQPESKSKSLSQFKPADAYRGGGEAIPDTPVTIYKTKSQRGNQPDGGKGGSRTDSAVGSTTKAIGGSNHPADPKDALQQLARATSSSPAPNMEAKMSTASKGDRKQASGSSGSTRRIQRALTTDAVSGTRGKKSNNGSSGKQTEKPTVEFAGLRRVRSTESSGSKRSSVHSEIDPTDRIEAEMKLFAPADNHSEKGSVRAPSPVSSDEQVDQPAVRDEVEATPKAKTLDPLSMPTPRVTGAYVETPVTVKVQKIEEPRVEQENVNTRPGRRLDDERPSRSTSRISTIGTRRRNRGTSSDPGTADERDAASISTGVYRRRAHSLSRSRPPVKNSAKPRSVKDDIKELRQAYNLDDSTLDDLEEMLSSRKAPSPKYEALLGGSPDHNSKSEDDSFDLKLEANFAESLENARKQSSAVMQSVKNRDGQEVGREDLETYDRMSKSLQTGLLGIRSVRQGLDRLEGNIMDSEYYQRASKTKATDVTNEDSTAKHQESPSVAAVGSSSTVNYILLPVPYLFKRQPRFHFTLLGLIVLLLSIWYTAEAGMCARYCIPTSCSATPCVWSHDDPTFGTALPVKFDQWITGGAGRALHASVREAIEDWVADVTDAAYGRDIRDIDIDKLSFEGRRAHRRRLRNKGLDDSAKQVEEAASPDLRARWNAWRQERMAREKAKEVKSMGYEQTEDESIGGDQRVW